MASGYKAANGKDLDDVFLPRANTKRGDVGFQIGGVDISNRYETIGSTFVAATKYKAPGGTDLANLFRAISEPLPSYPAFVGATLTVNVGRPTPNTSQVFGYMWTDIVAGSGFGSCAPDTLSGQRVMYISDVISLNAFRINIQSAYALPQNWFTRCIVNGRTFDTSNATFEVFPDSQRSWVWSGLAGFTTPGQQFAAAFS